MAASGPGITDIKLLFARSGNRCAFPKCRAQMAFNETLTGEICHINGHRPDSARHDRNQTDAERHSYANLILMCPTHHTVIDDDYETYTADRLRAIKASHEAQATQVPDSDADVVAQSFVHTVENVGQSGGFSANTVNAATITVQSAPSTSHLTRQRQIRAVEHLWQVVSKLKKEFSLVAFINSILTDEELNSYFKYRPSGHLADCVVEYVDRNLPLLKFTNAGADHADSERPFVTNRLWSIYFVLQAIHGRSALLLTNSYKERRYVSWRDDTGCDQLLRAILPARTVEDVKNREIGGLQAAIDSLESQFLAEAGMNTNEI
jgi:hypothetical protein